MCRESGEGSQISAVVEEQAGRVLENVLEVVRVLGFPVFAAPKHLYSALA